MIFNEKLIDITFSSLVESDDDPLELLQILGKSQPAIISYLTQENFSMLTEEEHDYLIFLVLVCITCFEKAGYDINLVEPEQIESLEESYWEIIESKSNVSFQKKITPFFELNEEEDMLAFFEDSLLEDEMALVSSIGREPMFICLLTIFEACKREIKKKS